LCATVGVAVVFVPQVAGTQVSGAAYWLMKDKMSDIVVCEFARQAGMAPGIVVGRLQKDCHLLDTELNELKEELAWVEPC